MYMKTAQTVNERLLELVQDYGGASKMAADLGMATPQIFYNLKGRPDSKPNSETIEKILSLLPDANANWLYKGVGPKYLNNGKVDGTAESPAPVQRTRDQAEVEAENARLKLENEFLRRERDQYATEKANYWKLLENMYERKSDFSTVSPQTTNTLFPDSLLVKTDVPCFSDFRQVGPKVPVQKTWTVPGLTDIADAVNE